MMLLLVWSLAALSQAGGSPSPASGTDLRCGAYCLYVSLGAVGLPLARFADLETTLGEPSRIGYSMQQLADAAGRHGGYTLGVQTTLANLERRPGRFACIAAMERQGHFLCITGIEGEEVLVVDPPRSYRVPRAVFEGLWPGRALLVADQPLTPLRPSLWPSLLAVLGIIGVGTALGLVWRRRRRAARIGVPAGGLLLAVSLAGCGAPTAGPPPRPSLVVQPAVVDLGSCVTQEGGALEGTFTLVNRGTAPLRILGMASSCGCTIVSQPVLAIRPGATQPIAVRVRPRGVDGPQRSTVTVASNDPATPSVPVEIRWTEQAALAPEPNHLDLGWIASMKPVVQDVVVRLRRGCPCRARR